MKRGLLLCGIFLLTISVWCQSLTLRLPDEMVADGATVSVPLTVQSFDSMVSVQLSINWDTEVATYQSFELGALPLLAIGDFQADQGQLRLSWFDNTGNGRSLEDDTVIATITFTASGDQGDSTPLAFTGDPLEIQIFQATGVEGQFDPVEFTPEDGSITIESPLGVTITVNNDVSCFGADDGAATVSLQVDPADFTINWSGPNGYTSTGLQQDDLALGTYTIAIVDAMGATVFTEQVIIEGPSEPLVWVSIDTVDTECLVPSGAIFSEATGGTAPLVYELGGDSNDTGDFLNLAEGTYDLRVVDANNCTLSANITIVAPDAPEVSLPTELSLCDGESVVLEPGGMGTYAWSTGESTESITVAITGTYSVTVTNAANCSSEASTAVVAGAAPMATLDNDFLEICPGDSLQLNVLGGDTYRWLRGMSSLGTVDVPDPLAFPTETMLFTVEVGNDCGTDTLDFEILVYEILATAGQDTCLAPGDPGQLQASGGIFYKWQDNLYPVSNDEIADPTVMPEDSTTYTVEITDVNGCVTMDDVVVLVANNPVESITPYNLITPNGDGKNDELDFGEIVKFGTNSLKVYNRWGDLVYQKLNYQWDEERFDGTFNGERLPAGNYFYVLEFRQGAVQQTLTIVWE